MTAAEKSTKSKRCETPDEHYLSARPALCTTPGCHQQAAFWTPPDDGDCPSCRHPRAIPATRRTPNQRVGRTHRAWCVPCRDAAVAPAELEAAG